MKYRELMERPDFNQYMLIEFFELNGEEVDYERDDPRLFEREIEVTTTGDRYCISVHFLDEKSWADETEEEKEYEVKVTTVTYVTVSAKTEEEAEVLAAEYSFQHDADECNVEIIRPVASTERLLGCVAHDNDDAQRHQDVWFNGSEVVCRTEAMADAIAEFLNSFGFISSKGYYDPEEDKRNNEVDECTGFWYVTV